MQNEQIKQKIEDIWTEVHGRNACEIEEYIQMTKNIVKTIIGNNQIEKVRHSSLLKLLIFELIIFIDQKFRQDTNERTVQKEQDSLSFNQRSSKSLIIIRQIMETLEIIRANPSKTQRNISISVVVFNNLILKLRGLMQEINDQTRMRSKSSSSNDSEGLELMIEQLESIIKRKQNRIKELNIQLQENFKDKQQLDQQIQHFQLLNIDLQQKIEEMRLFIQTLNNQHNDLQQKYESLDKEFNEYKHLHKEELLFADFNSNELSAKRMETKTMETTVNQDTFNYPPQMISSSTKILSKYCSSVFKMPIEERTVKKKKIPSFFNQYKEEYEQNLLRQTKQQICIQNENRMLERMILMQALCIESALQDIQN